METEPRLAKLDHSIFMRSLLADAGSAHTANQFASVMRELYLEPHTTIYRRGEPAEHIYFLVDGHVTLRAPEHDPWSFGPRSVVGVLDVWLDRPRDRTATADDAVHALALSVDDWLDILEDDFDLARTFIAREAGRLLDSALQLAPTGGYPEADTALGPDEDNIDPVTRLLTLADCPAFTRAGVEPLIRLARYAELREIGPQEALFRQGQPADTTYIVANGSVAIERDDPAIHARFTHGSLVGGPAALGDRPHAFTARAHGGTAAVLAIRHEDLFDVAEDHFELVRSMLAHNAADRDRRQKKLAPSPPG